MMAALRRCVDDRRTAGRTARTCHRCHRRRRSPQSRLQKGRHHRKSHRRVRLRPALEQREEAEIAQKEGCQTQLILC